MGTGSWTAILHLVSYNIEDWKHLQSDDSFQNGFKGCPFLKKGTKGKSEKTVQNSTYIEKPKSKTSMGNKLGEGYYPPWLRSPAKYTHTRN
jgi:hypothetical protein